MPTVAKTQNRFFANVILHVNVGLYESIKYISVAKFAILDYSKLTTNSIIIEVGLLKHSQISFCCFQIKTTFIHALHLRVLLVLV